MFIECTVYALGCVLYIVYSWLSKEFLNFTVDQYSVYSAYRVNSLYRVYIVYIVYIMCIVFRVYSV